MTRAQLLAEAKAWRGLAVKIERCARTGLRLPNWNSGLCGLARNDFRRDVGYNADDRSCAHTRAMRWPEDDCFLDTPYKPTESRILACLFLALECEDEARSIK